MCTYRAIIAQAVFERASVVVAWHVPSTTHDVVNVLAQPRSLRTFFASSETELTRGHEVLAGQVSDRQARRMPGADRPLMQLLQLAIVEYAGEDQAADGITWNGR
jgi:hypothetical protein